MGEFRIGRTFARHSYPDTPRGQPAGAFARNSAVGPATTTALNPAGQVVPWEVTETGDLNVVSVKITPRSTGRIRITAMITVQNGVTGPTDVSVKLQAGAAVGGPFVDLPLPAANQTTVLGTALAGGGGGFATIPLVADEFGVIGTPAFVAIKISASPNAVSLVMEATTIDIQETPVATG